MNVDADGCLRKVLRFMRHSSTQEMPSSLRPPTADGWPPRPTLESPAHVSQPPSGARWVTRARSESAQILWAGI